MVGGFLRQGDDMHTSLRIGRFLGFAWIVVMIIVVGAIIAKNGGTWHFGNRTAGRVVLFAAVTALGLGSAIVRAVRSRLHRTPIPAPVDGDQMSEFS